MSIYIGVDPGASGGFAIIAEDSEDYQGNPIADGDRWAWSTIDAFPMPATERDLLDALEGRLSRLFAGEFGEEPCYAVLERVWSSPGWGHVGAFKFGVSVGMLRMALTAARVPFDEVLPRKWQAEVGVIYPAGSTPVEKKNIAKRRAQQLFPHLKTITHATADALLMAEFCRRIKVGSNGKESGSRLAPEGRKQGHEEGARKAGRQEAIEGGGREGSRRRTPA